MVMAVMACRSIPRPPYGYGVVVRLKHESVVTGQIHRELAFSISLSSCIRVGGVGGTWAKLAAAGGNPGAS